MTRGQWVRLFSGLLLLASSLGVSAQQYVFRAYRQGEGLSNLSINAMAMDRAGFLWVGTENGVYRFLGSSFQRFGPAQGIAEGGIQEVFAAPDGTVWVGTYQNLYRWTGERFEAAGSKPIHLWRSEHMAAEGPGRLLVIDESRLFRLKYGPKGEFISYTAVFPKELVSSTPSLEQLGSLSVDSDGTLWMGCQHGLCSSRDGGVVEWGVKQGVPEEFWYTILRDREGSLWAASQHRVVVLPAGGDKFVDRTPEGSDPGRVFLHTPMALDQQGRVVVSTGKGIARWEGQAWKRVGDGNELRSSYTSSISFDSNGDAWLGSNGHGLYHWVGYNDWEGWSDLQGLPSANIWSLGLFRDGKIYVGTENGPARIDQQSGAVSRFFADGKWLYGQVSGMARDAKGAIWVGSFSGAVVRIQPQTGTATQIAKLPGLVFNLVQDASGRIFVPTSHGLYVVDSPETGGQPRAVAAVDAAFGGPPSVFNGCVAADGSVWFASDKRVFQYKDGKWSFPATTGFPDGMQPLADITCAADGALWVTGQQSGTWRLSGKDGKLAASELELPAEDRSLAPLAVLSDKRGWLWLGTDDGVLVWNGQTWRHLTQESGLIWNDINGSKLAAGPDGSIWFGTTGGLGHLIHPEQVFKPVELALAMINVQRGGKTFPTSRQFTLPWSRQDLSIQFASPSTLNRSDLIFSHRIPELDSDWIDTRDTRPLFPRLPPGRYTFEVMARNPAWDAKSAIISVHFRIVPPWWRTNWFYVLCAVALLWGLAFVYHLRMRHVMGLKRLLEKMVLERTYELVASREEMRVQATFDSLTHLLNRGAILSELNREMERSLREKTPLTVVLADIDFFKHVNDTYGHLAGDEALRQFALALREAIRTYDHVGRYGGEEFLLVLPGISFSDLEDRLVRLHASISDLPVSCGNAEFRINCCLGAVHIHAGQIPVEADHALAAADRALYEAKQAGRNRVVQRPMADSDGALSSMLGEGI